MPRQHVGFLLNNYVHSCKEASRRDASFLLIVGLFKLIWAGKFQLFTYGQVFRHPIFWPQDLLPSFGVRRWQITVFPERFSTSM